MSLKGHYYKVSYCGRDSRFRLFPAQIGCMLLTHPFLLQVFGVEADAKTCRKTAISACRVALQIIHSYIISAPDELREPLRNMTRMQLIRTPGSRKPSASEYRNVTNVYRIALKSLA